MTIASITHRLFHVVYLIQIPLSKVLVLQSLEHYLMIMQMQIILLHSMVTPSNTVPQNHTSFGIMAGMRGILCTDLAKLQNYISMSVMAISPLFEPEYISSSLKKSTLLYPQPIILTLRLAMQHNQIFHTSYPTARETWTERIHIINDIFLSFQTPQSNPDIIIQSLQHR